LTDEVRTAGPAAKIALSADRRTIKANGTDLSFVTVKIVDRNGVLVPRADNLVNFELNGPGFIAGVDNGSEISHESFKANHRQAFHGMALAIIQSKGSRGRINLRATSAGLAPVSIAVEVR
jgi:beta-galactosidase